MDGSVGSPQTRRQAVSAPSRRQPACASDAKPPWLGLERPHSAPIPHQASRAAALACACLVVVAAGCGGGEVRAEPPPLPAPLAQDLAARSDAVADRLDAGDACAARTEPDALLAETIAPATHRRVPRRYQEQLLGSVTALVESIECVEQPAPQPTGDEDDEGDDEADEDRGKGKAKGKDKKDKDRKDKGKG